ARQLSSLEAWVWGPSLLYYRLFSRPSFDEMTFFGEMTWGESARAAIKSDSLNLVKPQLDRCLTPEDLHQRLDTLRVDVHFGDGRMHGGKRPIDDHDRVADCEIGELDRRFGRLLARRLRCRGRFGNLFFRRDHVLDLGEAQRHRLIGIADKPRHRRSVPDHAPGFVR